MRFHAVNNTFRQHNRAVFSTQATHHVVQQIERLYLDSVNPELDSENTHSHVFDTADYSNSEYGNDCLELLSVLHVG